MPNHPGKYQAPMRIPFDQATPADVPFIIPGQQPPPGRMPAPQMAPQQNPGRVQMPSNIPSAANPDANFWGAGSPFGNPFGPTSMGLANEDPANVPFQLPEGEQPVPGRETEAGESSAGNVPNWLTDNIFVDSIRSMWNDSMGPLQNSLTRRAAGGITGINFRDQEAPDPNAGPPPEPISLLPPEAFGAAGEPQQDQGFQGQQISSMTMPGFTGGEALEGLSFPTMDPQARDRMLEQMEATRPPEFERQDPETSALLASMGQGLMDAETVGQALLGAGTGAQTALAQHAFEQDEREQAHEEARRQFDRTMAQVSFESDQALTQDQQRKADYMRQVQMAEAQLDNTKAQQMAQLARTSTSSDGNTVTVTEPEILEDGSVRLNTSTYTNNDVEEVLDAELLSDAPTVGGQDLGERMGSMGTTQKLTGYAVAGVVNGSITPSRLHQIQPEMDIDSIWNQVQQTAVQNVGRQQGFDMQSEEDLLALRQVDNLEDKLAIERWKAWMQLADQSPVVKQAILAASGHPISQRLAAQMGAQQNAAPAE